MPQGFRIACDPPAKRYPLARGYAPCKGSRGFGSHAIRLRNGIGLQADTPTAKPPDGKRRDFMSRYGRGLVSVLDKDRAILLGRSPYRKARFVRHEAVSDAAAEKVDGEIDG